MTLAGLGTAEAVTDIQAQRLLIFSSPSNVTAIAVMFWTATFYALAVSPLYVPLYGTTPARLAVDAGGFNALVGWSDAKVPDAEVPGARFLKAACFDGSFDASGKSRQTVCVWLRPGACRPGAASPPTPEYSIEIRTFTQGK